MLNKEPHSDKSPRANTPNLALLKLMYLVSPSLPIGAYAYSQGLEFAIESGWLETDQDLSGWIGGILMQGIGNLDLPVLIRSYRSWQQNDVTAVCYWNNFIRANRETRELQLEDDQLGQALQKLLLAHRCERASAVLPQRVNFVTMFALAAVEWDIALDPLLQGFCWSWLEKQIAAATKLVPLGQTNAQKLLMQLLERVEPVCANAKILNDGEIGLSLPGLAMASSKHERQYTRLFRS